MLSLNKVRLGFEYTKLVPKAALLLLARLSQRDHLIMKIPAYPLLSSSIQVTDNCNSRCITCNQWKERKTNELTTQEIKEVLKQLKEFGCVSAGLGGGGESLLRSDLGELADYARSLGFKRVPVVTNGLLLSQRAEELVESGVTSIGISLDGIGDTHDLIRGVKGGFAKTTEAIDRLNEIRKKGKWFPIGINTTLLEHNFNEIPAIMDLCEKRNLAWKFNLLDTSPFFFEGIAFEDLSLKGDSRVDELMDYIKARKRRNPKLVRASEASIEYARKYLKTGKIDIPCYLGFWGVTIGSKGEVYSHCLALKPLGNLREKKLRDIMTSEEYHERMLAMYKRKCPGCTCNYSRNIQIERLATGRLR